MQTFAKPKRITIKKTVKIQSATFPIYPEQDNFGR